MKSASIFLVAALSVSPAWAQSSDAAPAVQEGLLTVAEPYLSLHTGAGRGYPVFHVVERGQQVRILMRTTDWYRVALEPAPEAGAVIGWVHRRQLEKTLTAAGNTQTFRDVLLDDYLARRLSMGGAWGRFSRAPMLKLQAAYKLSDTVSLQADAAQVQGRFSGTSFWHIGVHTEPWSDQRWSPFFGVALGNFKNLPNPTLVGALPTDAKLAQAVLGARYYLSDRFVLQADWSIYTAQVSDQRSTEYRAATAGVAFFFQ
jgi:Bacterial SH3 domain